MCLIIGIFILRFQGHYLDGLLYLLMMVGLILLVLGIAVYIGHKTGSMDGWQHYNALQLNSQQYMDLLLQEGAKAMAVITSVEYVPARHVEKNEAAAGKENVIYADHGYPTFIIRYKFTPSGEANHEELRHYIYTHIEPEDHYAVGDSLPVLYRIYKNEQNEEIADSMPFPLPLDDIHDERNIYCHA
jgi:hypothetical protein